MSNLIKHLYIHIPFCKSKCPYCDFYSISSANKSMKDQYTASLIKELQHHAHTLARPLTSLYLGGGSPLMLGIDNLNILLKALSKFVDANTESTIELNPEHLEDEFLKNELISLLQKHLVKRVSIGVQTTNEEIKKLISRKYSLEKLKILHSILIKDGFNISFDFMFGLPNQTPSKLKKDLDFIKEYPPHHVSMYLFTPPEKYPLIKLLPNEEIIEQMFHATHKKMLELEYLHYEISNYALEGKESVHNRAYWNRVSYLGVGAAAHSFFQQQHVRTWHIKDVQEYIKTPFNIVSEGITNEMEYTETIMLGLRTFNIGVPEKTFKDNKYQTLLKEGLLEKRGRNIFVPYRHITILDSIIKELTC